MPCANVEIYGGDIMSELDLFVDNVRKKAERSSFEQNIDMVLAMCMRDIM